MSVKFEWRGSTEDTEGLAIFTTDNSSYEVWLPTFKKANQLHTVLRDIFVEGQRKGHREVRQEVNQAMDKVARTY